MTLPFIHNMDGDDGESFYEEDSLEDEFDYDADKYLDDASIVSEIEMVSNYIDSYGISDTVNKLEDYPFRSGDLEQAVDELREALENLFLILDYE